MDYFKPSVTVDAMVIWAPPESHERCVLLIQRKHDPFAEHWALPGGFIEPHEPLVDSVSRELKEETGLEELEFTQFGTFGDPGRDPRGRTLTVAYYAVIETKTPPVVKGLDDAKDARWFSLSEMPALAFDHQKIIERGLAAYATASKRGYTA